MTPAGTMQLAKLPCKRVGDVPYVAEGTGTDFLAGCRLRCSRLNEGRLSRMSFSLELNPNQNSTVNEGASAVDVTMTNINTNAGIGASRIPPPPITRSDVAR